MLTTKNEREGNMGRSGAPSLRFHVRYLVILAVIGLLAGCGPAGSHTLLKGKKLLDEGDYGGAVEELKSATASMPTNAAAWNYLGVAQAHAGQSADAQQSYQHALQLDRDLTEAHYNLGCLWLEQNRPDDAISEFTAYTLRQDKTPDGWLKLGLAQLRTRNTLSAEKSFSTALSLDPYNAEALNGLGLARMQRDRPEEAEKFFQVAVAHHPDYAPAVLNLATVAHQYLHDDRLALEQYRDYLALQPRQANWEQVSAIVATLQPAPMAPVPPQRQAQPVPPVRQTQTYAQRQDQTEATPAPRPPAERAQPEEITPPRNNYYPPREQTQTVRVTPEQPIVTAQPGTQQNYSTVQPVREPDEYASLQPNPPQPARDYNPLHWFRSPTQSQTQVTPLPPEHTYSAPAPVRVHVVPPAPPEYPSYLYLSPQKPAAGDRHRASQMFEQARQAEQQGKYTDSLNDYRMTTQLDPAWFEAQYNCGVMAYRLRDYQFAQQSYEMALAIRPDSADARYNFALSLKAANYVPDAVKQLKQILAANPNNVRAHLELGNLYAQYMYDTPRAREQYLRVLQLDPGNSQASNIQFWLSANPQ
jgi:tetratricopeptide (TPR) repeat protein